MNSSVKISIGIIGLGHICKHQIDALKLCSSKYTLSAICDLLPSRAQVAPEIPFYSSMDRMLSSTDMDVVLVSVQNSDHYKVAKELLLSGYDVIIEKPATDTVMKFAELVEIANSKNTLIHTAFHAAFAPDLLWFIENYKNIVKQYGPITAFRCSFYDPYIIDGFLTDAAKSLGGSWNDSGINALSVINQLFPGLEVEKIRLTNLPQFACSEIQGTADILFKLERFIGAGVIDTNWTLNVNSKITRLYFGKTAHRILLNHSEQQVVLIDEANQKKILFATKSDLPRLTTHYMGVFDDFYSHAIDRKDNREKSLNLHKMLYDSYNKT